LLETDLRGMVKEVDQDGNGSIEFDEFLLMMARKLKATDGEEEMHHAFKVFDKNSDGFITFDELKHVMCSIGERLTDEEIEDMIKEADLNGDKKIDYKGKSKFLNFCFLDNQNHFCFRIYDNNNFKEIKQIMVSIIQVI